MPDARIPVDPLRDHVAAIFAAAGNPPAQARTIATHLVDSNLAGHESHGVIRVPLYLDWQAAGRIVPGRAGVVASDSGAVATIDGEFGYGQVVGETMVEEGAARAARHGAAVVALRHAGHLGRIGGWAEMAAARGLVSLFFVNSPGRGGIQVAPAGGRER
ncbi:MAG: malate dehydrogenase, partial [Alphaproteobacteria bacterium]|nr:malate dehydrogenase [Alphaproteobacteria bacterium]